MKEITIARGYVVIVDDEDFEWISAHKWSVTVGDGKGGTHVYARRHHYSVNGKPKHIRMHREILGARPCEICDHINGNTLDNRRSNLRICSNRQNCKNQKLAKDSTSGFKGVTFRPKNVNKWQARIMVDGKSVNVGAYPSANEAARAYDVAAKKHHGDFARLNFPEAT